MVKQIAHGRGRARWRWSARRARPRRRWARTRRRAAPARAGRRSWSPSTASRQRTGKVRVALYGGNPRTFLERGQKLRKIDLPVTASGPMRICVAVPQAGRYAVAVRHDVDGNGRSGWSDGGGFSRNPRLSPDQPEAAATSNVAVKVGAGVQAGQRRAELPLRPLDPAGPRLSAWRRSRSSPTRDRPATSRCCRG